MDGQDLIGRNDVDVVALDNHAVGHFQDRHAGCFRQELRQGAFVPGRQMLDDDDRHPGARRKRLQECRQGFQTAGRSVYADDGKRRPAVGNGNR